jgi:flagellin-like protein
MFNFKKFRRNVKAISPVISVLLMIAVTVVASLVAYAWVMGYMGFQTAKTGQAIQIQSIVFDEAHANVATVYVQNVGDDVVTLDNVYIESVMIESDLDEPLGSGATIQIDLGSNGPYTAGDMITIKVTTEGGTYSEVSKVVPVVVPTPT